MSFARPAFFGGGRTDNRSNLGLPELRKEMHLAVQKGNIEKVKEILSEPGLDINDLDNIFLKLILMELKCYNSCCPFTYRSNTWKR